MSASHSPPQREKLLQYIVQSLQSKYSPNGCSESATPGRFCEPCAQLEAVEEDLFAHLKEVNKLLRKRTETKERVNQHHDRVTRRLPVEVVSYIFSIYTEDVNSNFDPRDPTVKRGPLLLGAVSRSWRRAAFSTPHLWNTISIQILSNDDLPVKVELAKEWLDRSRQLPLNLSLFYETSDMVESEHDALAPLFSMLQSLSPRWSMLVLRIPPMLFPTFIGEVTCAPILQTLKLIDDSRGEGYFSLNTPLLRHLDMQLSIPISEIFIEWSTLTSVEADWVTTRDFLDVLRFSETLESFRVNSLVKDQSHSPPTTSSLTHSALRELYLETYGQGMLPRSELVAMLNLVTFPSLEKFRYHSGGANSFPNSAMRSLFTRSRCRLTHFDLSGNLRGGTSDNLISVLSDIPTITNFKLQDDYNHSDVAIMSDGLLRRLFTPTDRLLPRLESLEFRGHKTFSWSCLASLVSATTSDGSSKPPVQPECKSPIRHISFAVYLDERMERIDTQSLAHFKSAQQAGVFHFKPLGDLADRVREWMFMF